MGSAGKREDQPPEERLKRLEDQYESLFATLQALKSELTDIKKVLDVQNSIPSPGSPSPYTATCPACSTRFDMLVHHYSIGLFDNMVYVKCPKCHKAWPVKGGAGGGIAIVADEKAE